MSTELENKPLDGNDAKLPVSRSLAIGFAKYIGIKGWYYEETIGNLWSRKEKGTLVFKSTENLFDEFMEANDG